MRLIYNQIALVLLLMMTATPQEINYDGPPPHNRQQFERFVKNVIRQHVNDQSLADSASTWLRDAGYLDSRVNLDDDNILITAGEQYRLDLLQVTADSSYDVEVMAPFTRETLDKAVERLLTRLHNQGHYFARATIGKIEEADRQVTIELTLHPGPLTTVAGKTYLGLDRTRPDVIDMYLPVSPGDTLTDALIERTEQAALEIEFADFVPPLMIRPRAGFTETDLEFRFRERKQIRFLGGGGYIPDDATGLVWNLDLTLTNIFGDGRQVGLRSERREKGRTVLDVRYQQPLFIMGVGQLGLKIATRDYRDRFYEFSLGSEYNTRLGQSFVTGLELGWKRVEPAVDLAGYSRFAAAYSIGLSKLDNRQNPSRGSDLAWMITFAHRRYSSDSVIVKPERIVFNETRTNVSLRFYYPLLNSLIGHLGLGYSGMETSETFPPESELTFIGGPGTLRGYRNEQFLAQRTATGTVEPRLRFDQGYLFVFYDAAYINRPIPDIDGNARTDELYRYGYGFGVELLNSEKSLKLSLGWNRDLAFDQPRISIQFAADI